MGRSVLFFHGANVTDVASDPTAAFFRAALGARPWRAPRLPEPETPGPETPGPEALDAAPRDAVLIGHRLGGSVLATVLAARGGAGDHAVFLLAAPYWGADPDWPSNDFALPSGAGAALAQGEGFVLRQGGRDAYLGKAHLDAWRALLPKADTALIEGDGHEAPGALVDDAAQRIAAAS